MNRAAAGAAGRELVSLDRGECLRLLGTVPVGRLIFTINALPAVRVMNFLLTGNEIVLRTAAGTTAARKAAGAIVTFEADQVDAATCSGWSVTVTGPAQLVTDPAAVARYRSLPLTAWAPGTRDEFLTVRAEIVEGQRITTGRGSIADAAGRPAWSPTAP